MSDNKNEKQKNMRFTPGTFPKAGSDIAKGIAILFMLFYHLFSTPSSNLSMSVNYAPLPESVFPFNSQIREHLCLRFYFLNGIRNIPKAAASECRHVKRMLQGFSSSGRKAVLPFRIYVFGLQFNMVSLL